MLNKTIPVITLDGPSGTGKGTLCHRLASALGWHFLDSGAIYRILAYVAILESIQDEDISALVRAARAMSFRFVADEMGNVLTYLQQQDISEMIRSEAVGQRASKIAAIPEVRSALLQRQRDFAEWPGLVTDGRDMGTVVFPQAILKVYLFATPAERAQRRYLQLQAKGVETTLTEVAAELEKRDARDMARTHSPLVPAEDAILLDTTGLSIVQVFDNILQLAREAL